MCNKVKDIDIKSRTYYFFNDIINIEDFNSNNIKEYAEIYSVNPFHLIFGNVNGYFEEINGNKYLTLDPTNESEEKNKKYEELWIKIGDLVRSITKCLEDYNKKI